MGQALRYLLFGEGETGLMVYTILLRYWKWTPEEDVRPLIFLMSDGGRRHVAPRCRLEFGWAREEPPWGGNRPDRMDACGGEADPALRNARCGAFGSDVLKLRTITPRRR